MIFISILSLIVAKALPSLNNKLSSDYIIRISAIVFIYAGVLSFNTLYIQSIGSGIGIYSGLFQITVISQYIEVFLLTIGSFILIAWPLNTIYSSSSLYDASTAGEFNSTDQVESSSYNQKQEGSEINKILQQIEEKASVIEERVTGSTILTGGGGKDYSLIVLFSTLGSCLLISSSDLVSMYLSIELQSFGLYVLSTLYRDSESSTSAGLKYFLLGGLSSCLILLGSGLIYAFTGLTQFESIYSLISVLDVHNITEGLSLGLILILVGFLFKIAAAPLHNWSPDVYDDTPTIVTIWLTIMPKIAILILILEIYTQSVGGASVDLGVTLNSLNIQLKENSISLLKSLLLISSLLSLIIGTVVGLAQTRIKRLLAYSTISHIGFILLALAINTEQSIDSLIFYIIQYSISNLNIFLIIIALSYLFINYSTYPLETGQFSNSNNMATAPITATFTEPSVSKAPSFITKEGEAEGEGEQGDNHNLVGQLSEKSSGVVKAKNEVGTYNKIDIRYISELKGQFLLNPLLSLSLAICLFSMAGIPPLIGFFSKQFVLYSALGSGYYFMSFVCIIVSVISASYYLKIIKVLYSSDPFNQTDSALRTESNTKLPSPNSNPQLRFENKPYSLSLLTNGYTNSSILSNFHSFLISTLTLFILLFIFKPSLILNSTQLLSLSLFYN